MLAYLPADEGFYEAPLSRFLPPMPKGVISTWLRENTPHNALIIDPIGANPLLAMEAASAGGKILFARSNPILWLMLEVLCSAPSEKDFSTAISKLMLSRQLGITLEEQIKSIYATRCFDCGERLQPDGYIWREGSKVPEAKIYHCKACGAEGEKPISEEDLLSLQGLGNLSLHRTRAFQRVAPRNEYERQTIKAALNCYLPRSLLTIMLLVNRLDRLEIEKRERRLLQAVLLSLFDDANSLWHWPPREQTHLQLKTPSRFLEKNLWLSLESASKKWQSPFGKLFISYYPQMPPNEGGICIYLRRMRDREDFLTVYPPHAIATLFARPNPTFWTLSTLWSGWLWGRKGIKPMHATLRRRKYNWHWFAQSVLSTMSTIAKKTNQGTLAFALFPKMTPNFYLGLACGMQSAGFSMQGWAYRPSEEMLQNQWVTSCPPARTNELFARPLIKSYLEARGEPAGFNELVAHCISEFILQDVIPSDFNAIEDSLYRQIQEEISVQLKDEHFVIAYTHSVQESSRWWLVDTRHCQPPLSERVERFLVEYLRETSMLSEHAIEMRACKEFPGLLTPSHSLVQAVLNAYAGEDGERPGVRLRSEEEKRERQTDLLEMRQLLFNTAGSLGFAADENEEGIINWKNNAHETVYRFYLTIYCNISEIVAHSALENNCQQVIVLPGSRSRLISFRLREDPHLAGALANNWHILKFRHLRLLAARENLTLNLWENLLDRDPSLWEAVDQTPLL